MKYYRVKVKLKTGFEYSYTCIQRMLEGMKKSSESDWTESITSEEITEEDFLKTREVAFEKEPKVREEPKKRVKKVPVEKPPEKKIEETKVVKKQKVTMASLENFFEGHEEAPENKKWKKRV